MSRYGIARVWIVTTGRWFAHLDAFDANAHLAMGRSGHDYEPPRLLHAEGARRRVRGLAAQRGGRMGHGRH